MINVIYSKQIFNRLSGLSAFRGFKTIVGDIAKNARYDKIATRIDEISQRHLEEKKITHQSIKQVFDGPMSNDLNVVRSNIKTANFLGWQQTPLILPRVENGQVKLLNSDKDVLIKSIAYLHETGQIELKKKVLIVNEGCDNGDYLLVLLPYLTSINRPEGAETAIILTNGHTRKLQGAAKLSKLLLSSSAVSFYVANAFRGLPPGLEKYQDFQKLHLFFRLVIVARPNEITQFIESRLKRMNNTDIAVASFLCADEKATAALGNRKNTYQEPGDDFTIFIKKTSKGIQSKLRNDGIPEQNLDIYNTAFTEKGIQDLIRSRGGNIIHMIKIPSSTDDRKDINIIGVVFTRKNPYYILSLPI